MEFCFVKQGPYSETPVQFVPTVSGTQIILTFDYPIVVDKLVVKVCTPPGKLGFIYPVSNQPGQVDV